jgi:dipeptidyl aminopeptidase/acylaminoacyl peptidase
MISRRQAFAGSVALPFALQASSLQAAETGPQASPPTIDEFLRPSIDRHAALSPNGKQIAILSARSDGERTMASVTIMDAENPTKVAVIQIGEFDVETVAWANDHRLLIRIRYDLAPERRDPATGTMFSPPSESNRISVRRIFAIDTDGRRGVMLFSDGLFNAHYIYDLSQVVDTLPDDPKHILMLAWHPTTSVAILCKIDVDTGAVEILERGTSKTWKWLTQNGVPVIRYDTNTRGTIVTIYVRAPGASDWTFFRKLRRDDWSKQEFSLLGPTTEPGVMLAHAYVGAQDVLSVRKLDLRTMTLGEVVASRPGRDVDAVVLGPDGRLIGGRYVDDRVAYQFLDPKMTAHFRGLNKYLNDECNIDIIDVSLDANRYLALVTGPHEPGAFYYYDSAVKRFGGIGQCRPWLTKERLASVETLSVKTRDGASLTAYLTVPLASGPRPLVVMPHGGPEARDQVDFDEFAQVLAAQGWMVIQPNFRGSRGYGKAFANAGKKHWGDRMQEDVEDAVALVLATGRIDKARVAICGASYGGYAALMGAVRNPDLYKAAVAIAADADLVESIAFTKSEDGADSESYFYWLSSIGDPDIDRAMMEAASPALHAERIRAPVLLIHGLEDKIVAPKQSRIMAKALKAAGKSVELIEMKSVGHRNLRPDDWRMVYTRSVDHIAKAFKA